MDRPKQKRSQKLHKHDNSCLMGKLEQAQTLFLSLVALGQHAHTLQMIEPRAGGPGIVILHVSIPEEGLEMMRDALEVTVKDVLQKFGIKQDTSAEVTQSIPKNKVN